ncbi:MAG: hypothetical protein KJO07_14895 [Deltaproteobacteria bacterium]|nr:hypothetical protein [Deltaproteobacteria bacterium]
MIRTGLVVVFASALLSTACGGAAVSGSASVSVSAEIKVPIAKMPPKYASWVVEAEGYLFAVDRAYSRYQRATADLAAALGVAANPQAIADFIRSAIQVETRLVCQPPSFNASLVSECSAQAGARAGGSAGPGGASGAATAGIQANCQARAGLSLKPGGCSLETTVSEHPILSNAAKWGQVETNMKIILLLAAVNVHLDGRGAAINARGLKLNIEAVTDLAKDPTLALQLNNIQAELKRGAEAVGVANDRQAEMNQGLGTMAGAIDGQFPDLSAAVRIR